MAIELEVLLALQVSAMPDTVVSLVIPPELTVFDYARGTLQILVLVVGLIALTAGALLAVTLRKSIIALQATVDRLSIDIKPLVHQATRLSEDAHDIVKTVRKEVDKLADATGEVSDRILDISDAAEERIDQVNALLDVLQDEVQDTALGAVATARGLKVGAAALGAALMGNGRGTAKRQRRKKMRKQSPRIRARDNADTPLFEHDNDAVNAEDELVVRDEEIVDDVGGDLADAIDNAIGDDVENDFDDELGDDIDDELDDDIDDEDDETRPYFDDSDGDSSTTEKSAKRRRPR